MKITISFAICVALNLTGCGMLSTMGRPYTEPTEGKTAKIRVITNGSVTFFPNRNCVDGGSEGSGLVASTDLYIGKSPTHNDQKIGMRSEAAKKDGFAFAEVLVKANSPLTLYFRADTTDGAMRYWCEPLSVAFIPLADEEYEVFGGMDDFCRLYAKSLSKPNQYPVQKRVSTCK